MTFTVGSVKIVGDTKNFCEHTNIWREFSLAFAQLYPIGGHYYWRSIGTEFLSLHLLFLPLEVLPKGCHHR